MKKHLALTGFMGCGKTTFGKKLSEKTLVPFIDLDKYIEEQENKSISEIFETEGEEGFRIKERRYLLEVLHFSQQHIIALGGGTVCYFDNVQLVLRQAWLIALLPPVEVLVERLWNEQYTRPLIKNIVDKTALKKFIEERLAERMPYYLQADCVIREIIT